jgi:hypothetical protein
MLHDGEEIVAGRLRLHDAKRRRPSSLVSTKPFSSSAIESRSLPNACDAFVRARNRTVYSEAR